MFVYSFCHKIKFARILEMKIKFFLKIKKCEVSMINNVNNENEAARTNTKQQQQQYSKWMRLQLMLSY